MGGGADQLCEEEFVVFAHVQNMHAYDSTVTDLANTILKGKFSSGIEGALASTLHHDFNWKQLSEMMLCLVLLMFLKFICVTLIQKQQKKKKKRL